MTAQAIVLHLLKLIGVDSLDPADNDSRINPGMTPGGEGRLGDIQFAITCLNQACQYIFTEGPSSLSERPDGDALREPSVISCAVVAYTKTATSAGLTAAMLGRTIRFDGDANDNQITRISSNTMTLARPYMGSTGTVNGTVYCDAILLSTDTRAVLEPVEIVGRRHLVSVTSRAQFDHFNNGYGSDHGVPANLLHQNKDVQEPLIYFVDSIYDSDVAGLRKVMRFNPMPGTAEPIAWTAKLNPPTFVLADIVDDEEGPFDDPETTIPLDWPESVVLPIACYYMTSHARFSNPSVERKIEQQYGIALRILADSIPHRAAVTAVHSNRIPRKR